METKLTINELAPYLPYELKMAGCQSTLSADILNRWERLEWDITPILRPLSDLTKEIEHNGEKFVPYAKLCWGNGTQVIPLIENGKINYSEMKKLHEWHFDVFGLIEKGLAININEI